LRNIDSRSRTNAQYRFKRARAAEACEKSLDRPRSSDFSLQFRRTIEDTIGTRHRVARVAAAFPFVWIFPVPGTVMPIGTAARPRGFPERLSPESRRTRPPQRPKSARSPSSERTSAAPKRHEVGRVTQQFNTCRFRKLHPPGVAATTESEHDPGRLMAIGFLFVRMLGDCFKSRRRLEAEILALRHQLNVLQRRTPRRLHLRWADHALFIWLYRRCPRLLDAMTIVRPETGESR
jgi:hypothetical protein